MSTSTNKEPAAPDFWQPQRKRLKDHSIQFQLQDRGSDALYLELRVHLSDGFAHNTRHITLGSTYFPAAKASEAEPVRLDVIKSDTYAHAYYPLLQLEQLVDNTRLYAEFRTELERVFKCLGDALTIPDDLRDDLWR